MKLSSKYIRVIFKLYKRALRRSPHATAITFMAMITFGLSSFIITDSIINHGRFSQSTFSKWDQFQTQMTGRSIASKNISQCNSNSIDLNNLKTEIKQLESQFETGHFIEGSLFGLNLKSLPSIQAQFLADHSEFIGDKNTSQNFTQCSTEGVPCIINRLYNGNQESGYLAYYWYLKTGSMISVSNKVPGQKSKFAGNYDNKNHLMNDYLFTHAELKNFYVLAKSLPEKFVHNPLLKSIHKIPNNSQIEGYKNIGCTVSTKNGHILISQACLGSSQNIKKFLLTVTNQIAKYVDKYEGIKSGLASVSNSQEWKEKSLWVNDAFFNIRSGEYKEKWFSFVPKTQFVSHTAKISPAQQLSQLLAFYRFSPEQFVQKTPVDLQVYIRDNFFNGQNFDGNGLYKQYITSAAKEWSKQEVNLWSDCFETHLKEETLDTTARELASQVDNPLYSCVEHKIPSFINDVVTKIKSENYEGCKFFQDQNQFGHLSQKFHTVLDKFLQEKILKRKIEFQNHGSEVLVGQKIKEQFISSVDPASVFINCTSDEDIKACYSKSLSNELNKIVNKHHNELSDYYKKIIKTDLMDMYSFSEISKKTNEVAKKFIAPFYNRVHFAATDLWASCKNDNFSTSTKIKLPMKFTGGKHFVNAKLINCINSKMDKELFEIVNMSAFHEQDEKTIEFKLNKQEKEFALSFMEGKLVQVLNNILDEEVKLESQKLKSHFTKSNQTIVEDFMNDKKFFEDVFSFSQISNECLERVGSYYPEKYFYTPTSKVDSKYGRKICSTIISNPSIKTQLNKKVSERWNENKKLATSFLDDHFEDLTDECNDDYPVEMGRSYMRNSRMRKICIEESFDMAVNEAVVEWTEDENYEHFSEKEQSIVQHLRMQRQSKIQKATEVK
jgi:hypothetical protein